MNCVRNYSLDKSSLRIAIRAGLGLSLLSFLVQRVFRVSVTYRWLANFTSRVLHSDHLIVEDGSDSVRLSLLASGGCYLNARHGIFIGKGTIFSYGVVIVSEDHMIGCLNFVPDSVPIPIGRDCWIGANTTILPMLNRKEAHAEVDRVIAGEQVADSRLWRSICMSVWCREFSIQC